MVSGVLPSPQSQRMLAAIVVTDAVGFSTRMSEDEETALRVIHQDLNLISELCQYFEGQVLKSTGDGLLMYFFSAVQAVECALEIQKTFVQFSAEHEAADHFTHRIGVHLGDVFINQADVMGTGVNIAARLEAACDPTGVCISQTVYDVIKSRLELNAHFLGDLQLKNIQEAVPAYQLYLAPQSTCLCKATPQSAPQTRATQSMTSIVQALEQHDNHLRLKKLIFSVCHNVWENDQAVLQQFDLSALIESLLVRNPTYEQCKASLYKIVATLNRKAAYAKVADILLEQLRPLFNEPSTQPLTADTAEPEVASCYQQVADRLDSSPYRRRITKVLYFLCHNTWERNEQQLSQVDSAILVQQLTQLATTPQDLKYRLHHLLQHLNRKTKYKPVIETIFKEFKALYHHDDKNSINLLSLSDSDESASGATQFSPPLPPTSPNNTIARAAAPRTQTSTPLSVAVIKERTDLFDLRLEISKYCNPLRAKILLHSVLYGPFGYSTQEWSSLKTKTLDDLLKEIFEYCPDFTDLESKLVIIAHCLEDVAEAEKVSSAIATAIKGYYPPAKSKRKPSKRKVRNAIKKSPTSPVLSSAPYQSAAAYGY
ncbi:MAG: adenylate/guanylate cyclase domain-containing protein [Cyanobacteria bacterium P01_D01_bin.44]